MNIFRNKRSKRKRTKLAVETTIQESRLHQMQMLPLALWRLKGWLILMVIGFGLMLFFWHPYFRVQDIECAFQDMTACPEEMMQELDQMTGRHILLLESQPIEQKLLDALSSIEAIEIDAVLPNTVAVAVQLHQPRLYLQTEAGGTALLVSETLEVIGADDTLDMELPRILYGQAFVYSIGDQIQESVIVFASDLVRQMKQEFVNFLWLEIVNSEQISVELADGNLAVFSSAVDVEAQVMALIRVRTHVDLEDTLKIIDVRFEQPVIKSR